MNKRLLEMKYMRHHGVFLVFLLLVLVSVALEASTVQLHIDVGLNHFYRRRYFEAFREFKAATEKDPRNSEAHYNLGRVYRVQGFLKEAMVQFQVALNINPNYLAAQRSLKELKTLISQDEETQLRITGQREAARLRKTTSYGSNADGRGQELLKRGKISEAIIAFEEAITQNPHNPRLFKTLGYLYFRQSRYSNALNSYQQAARFAPDDPEISYAIGLIYAKTSDFTRAAAEFNKAISLAPSMVKAHYALGETYEAQGRYEDAMFQFRKCLEMSPTLAEAQTKLTTLGRQLGYSYFSRGASHYRQNDFEKAEALLSMAVQYGSLTPDQTRQANEMLAAAQFWAERRRAEAAVSDERQTTRKEAHVSRAISVQEATTNPSSYANRSISWRGNIVFDDRRGNRQRFFVSASPDINADIYMDHTFGVTFPRQLPNDPRISTFSTTMEVKGRIVGFERIQNRDTLTNSRRRQPIVEAVEVTFNRVGYSEPLNIRFWH